MFRLYCSLLSVHYIWKNNAHTLIKKTLFLKNTNHGLGLQWTAVIVKAHWRQIIITNILSLKYWKNYQNVTQKHKVTKCCWKYVTNKLARRRTAKNLQFVKNTTSVKSNKLKPNKTKYACNLLGRCLKEADTKICLQPYQSMSL